MMLAIKVEKCQIGGLQVTMTLESLFFACNHLSNGGIGCGRVLADKLHSESLYLSRRMTMAPQAFSCNVEGDYGINSDGQ